MSLFTRCLTTLIDSSTPIVSVTKHTKTPLVECCRQYASRRAQGSLDTKRKVMRRDQTDKHTEIIEVDKSDKHRYYKWGYQPLPTQTVLDETNPHFAIRSPAFKLPNPRGRLPRSVWRQRVAEVQAARKDPELEKLARNRKLFLPLDEIENEWRKQFGMFDVNNLAQFYGIKKDLFQADDIILNTWLDVAFNDVKIHRGNFVTPSQLLEVPTNITFTPTNQDSFHTLIVTNLDGHPTGSGKEVVHWMICNICGGDTDKRIDTIFDYLPPLPWKGTGYHRLVFALYEQQNGRIQATKSHKQSSLKERFISSSEFTSANNLSPVGAVWCQVTWDESVSESCKVEDLAGEPVFDWEEYIEPKEQQKLLEKRLSELTYRNM